MDLPSKVNVQKKKEESPDENFDEGNDRNQGLGYTFLTHRGSRNIDSTVSEVIPSFASKI
jgi:hypothetical protein